MPKDWILPKQKPADVAAAKVHRKLAESVSFLSRLERAIEESGSAGVTVIFKREEDVDAMTGTVPTKKVADWHLRITAGLCAGWAVLAICLIYLLASNRQSATPSQEVPASASQTAGVLKMTTGKINGVRVLQIPDGSFLALDGSEKRFNADGTEKKK